ncbi:MAG: AraC family transcriptional regulator [Pseudomonadota bacterium]
MTAVAKLSDLVHHSYGAMPFELRSGGSLGAQFVDIKLEPHDITDAAVPELIFQFVRRGGAHARFDLGDGWIENRLGGGSVMVVPPDTEVGYDIPKGGEALLLALPRVQLDVALNHCGTDPLAVLGPVYETPFLDPALHTIAHRMWLEAARDDSASALFVDSAALALVATLMRRAGDPPPVQPSGATARMLARVAEYVDANLEQTIGLDDLAGVANLSSFHFHRSFRAATGITPHRYVTARRIERARRLLATDMPAAQVAFACGFASQSHFGQVFKAATGLTPRAYRTALAS